MRADGDLAALGAEHVAVDADDVADVELAAGLKIGLVHLIELQIKLDSPLLVHQVARR